ncbi:restriction endonuclease subunit S [Ectopseudomonas mendocina]
MNNGSAVGPQGEGRDSPSTFPTYPAYKNSGVDWCGAVPEHWALGCLKHLAWIRNGKDYKDVESPDGEYPVIGSGGQFANADQYLYEGESVLLGRKGTIDKPLYIHGRFWTVDTMFYTEISSGASAKFLYYSALTIPFQYYSTSTALPSMTQGDLLNHPCAIPSFKEQTQIARFLDHETARIDALIEEQQRLIELLKEKRQAVISYAVTKGLDPTVPMKDSGVEWLGEVPAHWDAIHVGRVCRKVSDGPHFSPNYVDEGVMFLSARNIAVDAWHLEDAKFVSEEDYREFCRRVVPEKGDVLYTKGGTTGIARVVDLDEKFQVWVHVAVLKLDRELVDPYYMAFSLNSAGCYEQSQLHTRGATNQDLGLTRMTKIWFALPPREEQTRICDFLNAELSSIDNLITEATKVVALLSERRSALISAAVTGKIDVRDWQPTASTQAPELEVAEAN